MDAGRRQYGTLDGMRGVAALAVVIVHTPFLMGPISAVSAGLAVDLFFVMSGFIIAHAYEDKLRSGFPAFQFIILRLIRLYPLYLLGLMIGAIEVFAEIRFGSAQLWTFDHLAAAIGAGLFMAPSTASPQDVATAAIFPLNPPSWSLFFEVLINVAYALSFPYLRTRTLLLIVALAGVALVTLGIVHGDLHFGSHWHNFAGGLARVTYSFGVGIIIYRAAGSGIQISAPPLLILLACGALFAVAPGPYTGVYEVLCVLVVLPALVVLGASAEPSGRLRASFNFLGLISYGVYSLHFPLALLAKGVLQKVAGDKVTSLAPWTGLAFLVGLVVICWIVDRIYDAPVRRYLAGLARAHRRPTASGEA